MDNTAAAVLFWPKHVRDILVRPVEIVSAWEEKDTKCLF